jgi:hypothetical protein
VISAATVLMISGVITGAIDESLDAVTGPKVLMPL